MARFFLLSALCIGIAAAFTVDDCPKGADRTGHLKVIDNFCFQFFLTAGKDYADARNECVKRGGDLAMPKTKALNDLLTAQLKAFGASTDLWIGLSDSDLENTFVWVDKTVLGSWSNFAALNGPRDDFSHRLEDCVAIRPTDGSWHDYHCKSELLGFFSETKPWVCQYTPVASPTTTASVL